MTVEKTKTASADANVGQQQVLMHFRDFWHSYPNLICYFRYLLCLVAVFTMHWDMHAATFVTLIIGYKLDIVDGRVARRLNQCTIMGDGIDSFADVMLDVLGILWWIRHEPELFPLGVILMSGVIGSAMFNFAIVATAGRIPKRKKGSCSGFTIILEWGMPEGGWSSLGWVIWIMWPWFLYSRAWYVAHSKACGVACTGPDLHFQYALLFVQAVTVVPAALMAWSFFALLVADWSRWNEPVKPLPGFQPAWLTKPTSKSK